MTGRSTLPVVPPASSAPPSVKRTALFAATPWEFAAIRAAFPAGHEQVIDGIRTFVGRVGDREYWLVRTGVGPEKAGRAASRLLASQSWALAISTGFACALGPAKVGDLIVGADVMAGKTRVTEQAIATDVTAAVQDHLFATASRLSIGVQTGPVLSVDRIVCRASEKAQLARSSGAIGLDMESAALAQEAGSAQVPFIVVRTVSDLVDEDLPLDFNLFLRPTGWLAGLASMLVAPSRLAGLARLRRQSRLAAANLTQLFQAYAMSYASAASGSRAATRGDC